MYLVHSLSNFPTDSWSYKYLSICLCRAIKTSGKTLRGTGKHAYCVLSERLDYNILRSLLLLVCMFLIVPNYSFHINNITAAIQSLPKNTEHLQQRSKILNLMFSSWKILLMSIHHLLLFTSLQKYYNYYSNRKF